MASHDTPGRRDPYFAGHFFPLLLLLLLLPITGEQRRARGSVGRLDWLKSTQSLTLRVDNERGCAGSGPREVTGEMVAHQCRGFLEACLGPLLHRYAASSILSPIRDAQTLNDDMAFFSPKALPQVDSGRETSAQSARGVALGLHRSCAAVVGHRDGARGADVG